VLFLDEPTGLDPAGRQRAWDIIRALTGEGVTVLLTTQYLDEADALANRIVVVDHGEVTGGHIAGDGRADGTGTAGAPRRTGNDHEAREVRA